MITPAIELALFGLLSSLHCAGMCGPLTLGLDAGLVSCGNRPRPALYHLGRMVTYALLGAIAAGLGLAVERGLGYAAVSRGALLFGGGVMSVVGLGMLGLVPAFDPLSQRLAQRFGRELLPRLLRRRGAGTPFLLGLLFGFIPCPLLWAALGRAAALHEPGAAAIAMAAFAAGTAPAVLATHRFGGSLLAWSGRFRDRIAAALVLGIAGMLLYTGLTGITAPLEPPLPPCCREAAGSNTP